MPRKVSNLDEMDKWNMYCPKMLKAKFMLTLIQNGHKQAQSAAVRALMELYTSGFISPEVINPLIEKHIIYKQDGNTSLM